MFVGLHFMTFGRKKRQYHVLPEQFSAATTFCSSQGKATLGSQSSFGSTQLNYVHKQRKQLWLPIQKFSSHKATIQSTREKMVNILPLQPSSELLDIVLRDKVLCNPQTANFSLLLNQKVLQPPAKSSSSSFTTNSSSILKFRFFLPSAVFWSSQCISLRLRFLLVLSFLPSSLLLFFIYLQARPERHCTVEIFDFEILLQSYPSNKHSRSLITCP